MTDPLRDTLQDALGSAYSLKNELGGGGMSRVFIAREEALSRDVVIKVLAPELAEGLSVERFAREIRLAAALQEPHIVPVLSAGVTSGGIPYYTMPFVRGASLRDRLDQGPIGADEALHLLRDVAHALAYAHAQGIVHRDIKPENILLSSGTAVVTDFGIAKALQASRTDDADAPGRKGITRTGTSLGTPAYMAPEQAAGDPDTDQRADLYAWGVVAYEMLGGRHPFDGSTSPQQLLTAHMVEVPAPLTTATGATPMLAALVMQCLAKDPDERPATAAALLQRLSAARTDGAGESGALRTTAVSGARSSRGIAIMVGAAVLLIASAGAWWRGSTRGAAAEISGSQADGPVMMAVLPFEHAGPADQQPFTDGLTDAVTAKLGALSSLMVIDRRSSATYRGTTKSTQQIGTELGVRYLLEGVVRWAKDGAGVWRARVTPTLVDAKSGAIKWTGEPAEVTLDDPFTAQGSIATDVAQAMEVAVLPKERISLARRFTDNPQAYAAYQRGTTIVDAAAARGDVFGPDANRSAIREFETALALDSAFSMAWSALAATLRAVTYGDPSDSGAIQQLRETMRVALRKAPDNPRLLLLEAEIQTRFHHDRAAAESLIAKAMLGATNNAGLLSSVSVLLSTWYPDSARVLAHRAAKLDPRSVPLLEVAALLSTLTNHRAEGEAYSEAMVEVDSTDERGWTQLIFSKLAVGDTIEIERLARRALNALRRPGVDVTCNMAFGSARLSRWLLTLSTESLRVASLPDSLTDYNCKTDAALRVDDAQLAEAYSDSVILLLSPAKNSPGVAPAHFSEALILAFAYANVSNRAMALKLIEHALEDAKRASELNDSNAGLYSDGVSAVYATIGDTAQAFVWLRRGLRAGMSARYLAINPRLRALHGTEEFRRLLREYDK